MPPTEQLPLPMNQILTTKHLLNDELTKLDSRPCGALSGPPIRLGQEMQQTLSQWNTVSLFRLHPATTTDLCRMPFASCRILPRKRFNVPGPTNRLQFNAVIPLLHSPSTASSKFGRTSELKIQLDVANSMRVITICLGQEVQSSHVHEWARGLLIRYRHYWRTTSTGSALMEASKSHQYAFIKLGRISRLSWWKSPNSPPISGHST